MVSKCANPACSATLHYLREGKVIRLGGNGRNGNGHDEHFWLCGPCSQLLDLAWDETNGLRIVKKPIRGEMPAAESQPQSRNFRAGH
jgi:hypothetical protein